MQVISISTGCLENITGYRKLLRHDKLIHKLEKKGRERERERERGRLIRQTYFCDSNAQSNIGNSNKVDITQALLVETLVGYLTHMTC